MIEQTVPILKAVEGLKYNYRTLREKDPIDDAIRTDYKEETMPSVMFHIMLATVTHYAVGFIYAHERGTIPKAKLLLLGHMLLRELMAQGA